MSDMSARVADRRIWAGSGLSAFGVGRATADVRLGRHDVGFDPKRTLARGLFLQTKQE